MFNKKSKKLQKTIEKSGLFDKVFYLKTYRDVRLADMTPIEHYVNIGIKEDRKPNAAFDPAWYREHYNDVKEDGGYPLVHYILFGRKENRFQNEAEKNKYDKLQKDDCEVEFCNLSLDDDYSLIKNSDYFDEEYYLSNYPDVKNASIDPVAHYLDYGYKEFRNPSKIFDTKFYVDRYQDVREAGINPLVHYLRYGYKESRKTYPSNSLQKLSYDEVSKLFNKGICIPEFAVGDDPIDIVIPVYNGIEYLEPLFKSLVANTTLPYRLLICDDKSPDQNVLPLLQEFKNKNKNIDILLLENEENLGFIKTVNRLVEYTKNHFVLLNTDTEVPTNWLERLMYPIFEMKNIASTTPFTNAGTICSFPNYLEDNKILNNMGVNDLDEYFKYVNFENNYIEIPTGVGFAMGVNKHLVDKIGMFDIIFGKGYGEENDWCQRAIKEGYKNLHVPNLFVYHKHGGSFASDEKKKLIEKNLHTLNNKHNTFDEQVQTTIQEDKLRLLRNMLYFKIMSSRKYASVIFDHNLGGGANHYLDDLIKNKKSKDEVVCLIRYDFLNSKHYRIDFITYDKEVSYYSKSLFDLYDILNIFSFDEIFLNSFVSYPNIEDILKICRKLKNKDNKLVVPIHDYFPICPSYTLLNNKMEYCNIPKDFTTCNNCLKLHKGEFKQFEKEEDINNWRSNWKKLFDASDEVLCFSNASKDIFYKAYPEFIEKVRVIPHDISGRYENIYDPELALSKTKVIGILGGINEAKGAKVVQNLVDYIKTNNLNAKIISIGELSISIEESEVFHCTGRYKIEKLPDIINENKITEFLIPSICPETFSYTTDEIMQLGYPLTVFDLGAPAERVCDYPLGKVISMDKLYVTLFEKI